MHYRHTLSRRYLGGSGSAGVRKTKMFWACLAGFMAASILLSQTRPGTYEFPELEAPTAQGLSASIVPLTRSPSKDGLLRCKVPDSIPQGASRHAGSVPPSYLPTLLEQGCGKLIQAGNRFFDPLRSCVGDEVTRIVEPWSRLMQIMGQGGSKPGMPEGCQVFSGRRPPRVRRPPSDIPA